MPLPPVLSPDSSESPLLAILVNAWNRLKQSQVFATLCDLFVLYEHFLVGLPLILTETTVCVLPPCTKEWMIRTVANLVHKNLQDALRRVVQDGQFIKVIVAVLRNIVVDEVSRVPRVRWFVSAPYTIRDMSFNTITSSWRICLYHSCSLD